MEDVSVLIQRSQAGDTHAREVLIENNLGLVRHVVRRFAERGVEAEDLFQIGTIGLMKAVDHFDVTYGVRFSTYAVPMIMGEIRQYLREDGLLKVSRSLKENAAKLSGAREALWQSTGREPTLKDLARETGLSREDALLAWEAGGCVQSLEGLGAQGEEGMAPLLDRIAWEADGGRAKAVTDPGERDAEKEKLLDRLLVKQMMETLEREEQKLLWLRFFRDKTQAEVSLELGISQVQVSRKEKKIIEKLRKDYLFDGK